MIYARQSTAIIVTVGPVLDAGGTAVTDGVVGDYKISKNGGAPAALNGSATYTHRHTGYGSLSLTASDVDTVGTAEVTMDDTTNVCPIKEIQVLEPVVYDALFADAATGMLPANVIQWLGTAPLALSSQQVQAVVPVTQKVDVETIKTNAVVNGGTVTFPTNSTLASTTNITAGTVTTATNVTTVNGLAANVITAASMAADASTEIRSLASGTSDSGTTTTMVDAARTEADDSYWNGMLIVFTSGNIAGQARVITGFTAATDTITFAPATTQAVSTQTYEIWPVGDFVRPTTTGRTLDVSAGGEAGVDWANVGSPTTTLDLSGTTIATTQKVDVETIKTNPVANGGTVTFPTNSTLASTTNITAGTVTTATNVTTVNGLAAGVITAAAIATGAIDADALAADASTEIRSLVSGTSDSGTTTTMVDAARTEADDDYWKGMLIVFTSGNIAGQARVITGFTALSDTITFSPATTQAVATQTYEIWPVGDFIRPTTTGRTLDVSAGGEAGVDWANVGSQSTSVNLSATTINLVNTATTVTNQLTAAQVATGVWQDTTAGDFTVASSIGKSLYTSGVVPGGSGGLIISGTNSGTTTLAALTVSGATTFTGAVTGTNASNDLRVNATHFAGTAYATALAAEVDAVWDEDATAHQTTGTFGATLGDPGGNSNSIWGLTSSIYDGLISITGSVNDAGATTTVFNTTLTQANDYWNDALLTFTSGALSGQTKPILDFANTNGQITLDEATTSAPANGVTFSIIRTHVHPISQIASGVWKDTTAGDFTVASSIGKSLYTSGVAPGGSGGLLISGTNSGTTTLGALTVSGATTLSGAVSLGSTLGVTGTTTLAALTTTGTTTLNALTVSNATTLSGAVSLGSTLGVTGAITATNASNNITLGTFTVTTNAIAWNSSWDAEVESEATDALTAQGYTSARAGYIDELAAANIPADVDQIKADLPSRITKNTALANFEFLMVDATDGYTAETGLTITATRSIDGAAFAACANSATEVSNGIYKIDLAAADLNGNVITLKFAATGARTRIITIVTQP